MYEQAGPWASVYLDTTGSVPHARDLIDLRWRALQEQLKAAQADPDTIQAIEEAIFADPAAVGEGGHAVFATHGEVGLSYPMAQPPARDVATWSIRPHTAALVRSLGEQVRWIRADVDRAGGTLTSRDGGRIHIRGESTYPITKVSPGGWAQSRFQREAEENWGRNSGDVASAVQTAADRTHADVIVLSGDVRARELLIDRLPPLLAGKVVEVDYESPSNRDADAALDEATSAAIAAVARTTRQTTVDRFHNGLADGAAVNGLADVADAARERSIEVLLIGAESSPHNAWVDPADPTFVGADNDAVRDFGVSAPAREDAEEALIGAAAMTDADLVTVDAADARLIDGLGAILRYFPQEPPPPQ
jgi:peptide subunit release factor 1 (eRF1)